MDEGPQAGSHGQDETEDDSANKKSSMMFTSTIVIDQGSARLKYPSV